MTEHPQEGGSFTRQPDGSLKRAEDAPPAVTEPVATETETPPASRKGKS